MTVTLTREILLDLVKDFRERDPLLNNGVQLDWVCVINRDLVAVVRDTAKQYRTSYSPKFFGVNQLDQILMRRTFIIEDAPKNIEYMPESVMQSRYADYFKRWPDYSSHVAEWLESMNANPPDNDPET